MSAETVKVIVRCRPMNSRETAMKCKPVVQINHERCACSLLNPSDYTAPPKIFTFDSVYGENSTTEQIYNEIAYPLIESVLSGYNSTIFAYGQTGCGKSFSMQGVQDPDSQRGIIPRAFEHIFEAISLDDDYKYLVLASYLEIYNEEIRDLLGSNTKRKLELKENPDVGVYVCDLSYHTVHNVAECQKLMEQGWRNRAIGATLMNTDSSRSHSIFTISVEMMPISQTLVDYCPSIRRGKLNLVDLAGSERQSKTGAVGDRLKEATKINLSLSALGNVISALVDGKAKHIPYRDSKLTRLLQDSLGGNTKTLMVACLSPADNNYDETLSTLRYANRAKNICNQPHVNEDPKDTMLREYQEEIQKLRRLLDCSNLQLRPSGQDIPMKIMKINDTEEEPRKPFVEETKMVEYEREMQKLKKQYEEEYLSKCQVQADLQNLKKRYEEEVSKLNGLMAQKASAENITKNSNDSEQPKVNAAQVEILKRLQKLQSSMIGGERVNDRELKEKRLRKKRAAEQRLNALAKILAKVEDEEGPNLVLKVYDDIQEELKVKTDLLRKYKQKVKAQDREIEDLHSEFENERTDYLETIRKQECQLKLHNQILENILPVLSKECNYSNIEKIKEEAKWCDESQLWILPSLKNARIKFPPAGGDVNKFQQSQKTAPAKLENNDDTNYALRSRDLSSSSSEGLINNSSVEQQMCDVLYYVLGAKHSHMSASDNETTFVNGDWNFYNGYCSGRSSESNNSSSPEFFVHRNFPLNQKLNNFELENLAGNYFKPRRAAELLMQAKENATKSINKWKDSVQQYQLQTRNKEAYYSEVFANPTKSKLNQLNAQNFENNRSRSWTRQASPVTWMTGNVHISPDMLPKRSTKIDLLPLISEKRNSFEPF